jgi:hypothetical protein
MHRTSEKAARKWNSFIAVTFLLEFSNWHCVTDPRSCRISTSLRVMIVTVWLSGSLWLSRELKIWEEVQIFSHWKNIWVDSNLYCTLFSIWLCIFRICFCPWVRAGSSTSPWGRGNRVKLGIGIWLELIIFGRSYPILAECFQIFAKEWLTIQERTLKTCKRSCDPSGARICLTKCGLDRHQIRIMSGIRYWDCTFLAVTNPEIRMRECIGGKYTFVYRRRSRFFVLLVSIVDVRVLSEIKRPATNDRPLKWRERRR